MMSQETQTAIPTVLAPGVRPTAGGSGLVPYRLTVRQFEKMIAAGVFRDEDHVELLGGLLVEKMVKQDPHNFTIDMLGAILSDDLPDDWIARQEKSVVLGRFWRPEPDIAVVRGPRERYRSKGPRRADLAMLVEVADSSYAKDRGTKWRKYAATGVAVYWIVNLPLRQIEVYSAPAGRGKSAAYRDIKIYGPDDEVPLVLDGRELGRIKVSEVLA
jgi:Uma2 family endonuclease